MRSIIRAGLVAGALAGALAGAGNPAIASTTAPRLDCVNPDLDKHAIHYASAGYGGSATFYSWGDHLRVTDNISNGRRAVAKVWYCYDGEYRPYMQHEFDSGPNDGPIDTKDYYFKLREGRRLWMEVCERTDDGTLDYCGTRIRMWA